MPGWAGSCRRHRHRAILCTFADRLLCSLAASSASVEERRLPSMEADIGSPKPASQPDRRYDSVLSVCFGIHTLTAYFADAGLSAAEEIEVKALFVHPWWAPRNVAGHWLCQALRLISGRTVRVGLRSDRHSKGAIPHRMLRDPTYTLLLQNRDLRTPGRACVFAVLLNVSPDVSPCSRHQTSLPRILGAVPT